MANEPVITIVGNLTAPAEIRFTPSGSAVANFTVASTPKTFDKQTNEYKDGETLFMRCSIWREAAENAGETLSEKGMRVIVQGRLKSRSYETTSGEKRTVMELEADEVGPSIRWATAKVTRTQRNNNGGGSQSPSQGAQNVASQLGGQPQQGWGAPSQDAGWPAVRQEEVPF